MESFGNRLKSARLAKELTQDDLAKKVEAYQSKYRSWEADIHEPDFDTVKKLAAVLDVSVEWLMGSKGLKVKEEQAEYITAQPTDPITTKLLLLLRNLDKNSKNAVLKYAEEKRLIQKLNKGGK